MSVSDGTCDMIRILREHGYDVSITAMNTHAPDGTMVLGERPFVVVIKNPYDTDWRQEFRHSRLDNALANALAATS